MFDFDLNPVVYNPFDELKNSPQFHLIENEPSFIKFFTTLGQFRSSEFVFSKNLIDTINFLSKIQDFTFPYTEVSFEEISFDEFLTIYKFCKTNLTENTHTYFSHCAFSFINETDFFKYLPDNFNIDSKEVIQYMKSPPYLKNIQAYPNNNISLFVNKTYLEFNNNPSKTLNDIKNTTSIGLALQNSLIFNNRNKNSLFSYELLSKKTPQIFFNHLFKIYEVNNKFDFGLDDYFLLNKHLLNHVVHLSKNNFIFSTIDFSSNIDKNNSYLSYIQQNPIISNLYLDEILKEYFKFFQNNKLTAIQVVNIGILIELMSLVIESFNKFSINNLYLNTLNQFNDIRDLLKEKYPTIIFDQKKNIQRYYPLFCLNSFYMESFVVESIRKEKLVDSANCSPFSFFPDVIFEKYPLEKNIDNDFFKNFIDFDFCYEELFPNHIDFIIYNNAFIMDNIYHKDKELVLNEYFSEYLPQTKYPNYKLFEKFNLNNFTEITSFSNLNWNYYASLDNERKKIFQQELKFIISTTLADISICNIDTKNLFVSLFKNDFKKPKITNLFKESFIDNKNYNKQFINTGVFVFHDEKLYPLINSLISEKELISFVDSFLSLYNDKSKLYKKIDIHNLFKITQFLEYSCENILSLEARNNLSEKINIISELIQTTPKTFLMNISDDKSTYLLKCKELKLKLLLSDKKVNTINNKVKL